MRRIAAAAAVWAAACHPAKVVAPARVPVAAIAPDAGPVDDSAARAEAAWARRETDPGAVDQAILLWENAALHGTDPSVPLLDAARARRTRIARAQRAVDPDARAIGEDALACAADAHRSWAAQFPAAAAQLDGTHSAAEVYAAVGAPAAEALYLEAVCSAAWARMQGFTPLIERRAELTAALERVIQLAPSLDGGGPERELGTLLAALPAYAGGDLAEARRRLESAAQRAPQDPRNHLAVARTVAVKAQDRALFERELAEVKKSDDAMAAADADALLQREDDLFGPREK
ncbi:MAG: TRAP transporter TatT component family protein [Myxococcales bacterium]|nr:TRAP transporter TatT component family protein [Myxococcales bacterium]